MRVLSTEFSSKLRIRVFCLLAVNRKLGVKETGGRGGWDDCLEDQTIILLLISLLGLALVEQILMRMFINTSLRDNIFCL